MKVVVYKHADNITGDDSFSFEPAAGPAAAPSDRDPDHQTAQTVKVPDGSTFVAEKSGKKLLTPDGRTYGANSIWFLANKGTEGFSL